MDVILRLIISLYLLWLAYVIARREYGAMVVAARRRKVCMELRDGALAEYDDRHRAGITEVLFGPLSMAELEEYLSADYPHVEFIWVCDLAVLSEAEEVLRRYNMFPMELRACEGLPCRGVRRIYRSRSRRYKRLVIVDSETTSVADGFNCAVEAATYDLILPLERSQRPQRTALRVMAEAYGARERESPDWIVALAERSGAPRRVVRRYIEALATGDRWGAWRGRNYLEGIYLFRREAIIAVGGFVDGSAPCCDMVARVRLHDLRRRGRVVRHGPLRHSPHSHGPALRELFPSALHHFVPVVVAECLAQPTGDFSPDFFPDSAAQPTAKNPQNSAAQKSSGSAARPTAQKPQNSSRSSAAQKIQNPITRPTATAHTPQNPATQDDMEKKPNSAERPFAPLFRPLGGCDLLTGRPLPPAWLLDLISVVLWGVVVVGFCMGEPLGAALLAGLMIVERLW